jgi:hypothetical protein
VPGQAITIDNIEAAIAPVITSIVTTAVREVVQENNQHTEAQTRSIVREAIQENNAHLGVQTRQIVRESIREAVKDNNQYIAGTILESNHHLKADMQHMFTENNKQIKDMIADVSNKILTVVGERFDRLDARLDRMDKRNADVEGRIDDHELRLRRTEQSGDDPPSTGFFGRFNLK